MRRDVARSEIVDRVRHIRSLLRQKKPRDEQEQTLFARYESKTTNFLSNIRRSSERPTLNQVRIVEEACSLTADGSHRLFGYEIDEIRNIDARVNRGRTHIVESYVFERDLLIELPLELAASREFSRTATLATLVRRWQRNIPIAALNRSGWRQPGTFHVRVGTEDSVGSNIPPGAIALVQSIGGVEIQRPNPGFTYLLQFANGYQCSRCVVSGGKLQLLTSDRSYFGTQRFSYPGSVRIVGRVHGFAVALPLPSYPRITPLSDFSGTGDLLLPWEQPSRERLFAMNHKRFVRQAEEGQQVADFLEHELGSRLSDRTRRRYRHETDSEPHVDALIQISLEHFAPYSDTLRAGGYRLRDKGRFSLETMLRARYFDDLLRPYAKLQVPTAFSVWEERLRELVEWPSMLSAQFPQLSRLAERIIRIAADSPVPQLEPNLRTGSWILTEELPLKTDLRGDSNKTGWSRPLYVVARGQEILIGHIHAETDQLTLLRGAETADISLTPGDLSRIRRVCGAFVPI